MSTARTRATQPNATNPANERFARPLIGLHWTIAIITIAMLCIGFYMGSLPRSVPFKLTLTNFHKSLGTTVFLLVLLCIWARSAYGRPPLPPMQTWQRARREHHAGAFRHVGDAPHRLSRVIVQQVSNEVLGHRAANGAGTTKACGTSFSRCTNISRGC